MEKPPSPKWLVIAIATMLLVFIVTIAFYFAIIAMFIAAIV